MTIGEEVVDSWTKDGSKVTVTQPSITPKQQENMAKMMENEEFVKTILGKMNGLDNPADVFSMVLSLKDDEKLMALAKKAAEGP